MKNKIGETFRRLREQRGYTLSRFDEISISRAALSKFERGEAMMAFDKVVSAIQFMGVSLAEFEQFFSDYSLGETDRLVDEIQEATFKRDSKALLKLYERAILMNFPIIALSAKASTQKLNEFEAEQVTQYFYDIIYWGYKELGIFNLTMESVSTRDILYILKAFLYQGHELFEVSKFRSYLAQTCCQAVAVLSRRGHKEYARELLEKIDFLKLINTMYLRNLRNLTYGYWVYQFVDKKDGDIKMQRSLEIMKAVGTPEVARYYLMEYKRISLDK